MPPCFGYSSFVPSGVTIWRHRPLPRSAGSVYVVHAVPQHILCDEAPHPVLRQLWAQRMETNTAMYLLSNLPQCLRDTHVLLDAGPDIGPGLVPSHLLLRRGAHGALESCPSAKDEKRCAVK